MLVNLFDTHAYVKKLVAVGFTEQQAEVQAVTLKDIIEDQLATKKDVKESEIELKKGIKELDLKIENVKKELKLDIKDLELKMETIKSETFKWLVGLLLGQAALIATLVKFISH